MQSYASKIVTPLISGEALESFEKYHDNLVTRQSKQHNENIQGILSKVRGFTARLSMILFALEQAINISTNNEDGEGDDEQWSDEITTVCVEAAATIMDYLIQQKLIMMDLIEVSTDSIVTGNMGTSTIPKPDRLKEIPSFACRGC